MDPTKYRMRYLLGILTAAVVTAALLRHFLHVDAGFNLAEIFIGASVAAIAVFLTAIFFSFARRP